MDTLRAILDGVAIAAIFNGAVASLVLINPRWFFDSYSKAIQNGSSFTHDKAREKNKSHIKHHSHRDVFCLFSCKPFAFKNFWFLEFILDELYSLEHLKCRRFFAARLPVISR